MHSIKRFHSGFFQRLLNKEIRLHVLFAFDSRQAILTVFICLLVLIAGCTGKTNAGKESGRAGRSGPVPVEIKVLEPGEILNELFTTGTLMANEKSELRTEVTGRITGIFFDEGSIVEKGHILVKINDSELQAQLIKVTAQEKLAGDEEFRKRKLKELNAISQEEYDISLNQLNAIQADKNLLLAQIEKTEIRAPFNGKIGLRSVSLGSYVSSSSLIAILQQLDPIKIEFSVPEKYDKTISKGTTIHFSIEGSEKNYSGKVYAIESGIDPVTRTIKSRAICSNTSGELVPGTFARILIVLKRIPDALKIPSEALIPELNGNKVFLCKNGKAQSVPVQTGIRTETEIQIIQGLSPGDSLVCTGLMQLSEGSVLIMKDSRPVIPERKKKQTGKV